MRHGSLFSGIGGFDLAAQKRGWENVFHCEWNPFGQKILKHYWPDAISYEDITKTDFTVHRGHIDILTGGFPCQPYSSAGKRLGKEDERHLWPEMLRAIREIQPRFVVGENVSGLVNWNGGMVFDEVQADLEAEGYEVTPFLLPAAGVNAPHKRERVWFIAYRSNSRAESLQKRKINPNDLGFTPNTTSNRRTGKRTSTQDENREPVPGNSWNMERRSEGLCSDGNATNSKIRGLEYSMQSWRGRNVSEDKDSKDIPSNADGFRLRGQGDGIGESGFIGENKQGNYWQDFPTQSPVCDGDDGLSSRLDGITFPKWRNESIKAGGNAIVHQVALQIFKAIDEFQHQFQH